MRRRWALIPLALVLSAIVTWTGDPQPADRRNSTVAAEQPVAASAPAPSPGRARLPNFDVGRFPVQLAPRSLSAPQSLSAPPAPQAPLLPYRYVGRMTFEGATLAFLERQGNVLTTRVGEILDSMYRVDAIGSQSVRLTYLPLNVTQIALAAYPSAAAVQPVDIGDKPVDIVFKAPTQATQGSTIEVSVGVPPRAAVKWANFLLSYDADALDLLEVTDVTGAIASVPYHPPGTVELNYQLSEGATQLPTARFVAKGGDKPHSAEIAVTAELFDAAGQVVASNPFVPHSLVVMP